MLRTWVGLLYHYLNSLLLRSHLGCRILGFRTEIKISAAGGCKIYCVKKGCKVNMLIVRFGDTQLDLSSNYIKSFTSVQNNF